MLPSAKSHSTIRPRPALIEIFGIATPRDGLAGLSKTCHRDDALAGVRTDVKANFVYEVDGAKRAESFDLELSIDSDTVCASSSLNVSAAELMAFFLGKFNAVTRSAILTNLVDTWKESGETLPTDATLLADCEDTLKKIRKANQQHKRGAVKVRQKVTRPSLTVVG